MESEGPTTVRLAVLGDIAVYGRDGAEAPLSPQRSHILAVLAAAAGSVVARSDLLDDLWGEDNEATRHRLKSQIAQIRALLGPSLAVEFHHDGYRLRGALGYLDSTLFESLVMSGRELAADVRVRHYEHALGLWRGPSPFRGVDSVLVDDARRRLELLRTTTVLDLADGEIELGRPRRAGGLLAPLFADDPTRPDVARRLATLLALGRRDVESLRVIRQHRDALVQAGYLLAPDLQELEHRVLRQEFIAPALSPTLHTQRAEPGFSASTPFIARPDLESRVTAALAAAPVVLCGEGGVGKTVLTRALARRWEDAGRFVLQVAAHADPTRPMEVMAEIIQQCQVLCPGTLKEQLQRPGLAAAVARLSGEKAGGRPPVTRDVLLAELTGLVHTLVTASGGALIVEDGHWLDHSSAEIIGNLIGRRLPGVLVTSRRSLTELFGERWQHATVIEAPPFTVNEVRALLERTLPARATDELVRRLHRASGGNGLFLRLELDLLADGQLGRNLPTSLLEAVHERTRRFSESTRQVLQTAALLGPSFPLAPLAEVHPHLYTALGEAEEERLVRLDLGTGIGEFVHGLVVEALADLLPPATRVARHDQLCRALVALDGPAAAVATHAVGAEALDPIRAVERCLRAAQEQAVVFEWASVIDWARLGLQAAERAGFDHARTEAELRALVGAALRRLNIPGSDAELSRAADLAMAADAPELLVRCATELCLHGPTTKVGTIDAAARRHLDRALAAPVPELQRAELRAAAATLMALTDEARLGRALYHQALATAEGAGDPGALRKVWMNAHLGLSHPDDIGARRRACAGLLALDDHEAQWEGSFLAFGLALIDADRARLESSLGALRRLTGRVKQRDQQRALHQVEAAAAFIRGDLGRAEQLAGEAFEMSLASYPVSWASGIYAALLVPIREAQGRAGDLLGDVAALTEAAPGFITWHAIAAAVAYARGDTEVMARELSLLAARDFQFAEDLTWTAVATMVCRPVWAMDDGATAAALYERLLPFAGSMTWNGLSTHGPVDAGLACLAAVRGDAAAVGRHLAASARLVHRLDAEHLRWPELALLDGSVSRGFAQQRDRLPQLR